MRDSEVSAYFYKRAGDWIRSEPSAALALFLRKLWFAVRRTSP